MLDVFFISMGEKDCELNWERLLTFAPNAKRVTDIKGIYEVHKECAILSTTDNFYVVDADAWIVDEFDFTFEPSAETLYYDIPESECVLVWKSINPVNGLVYGNGGVKLFTRQPFIEQCEWELDLTTTIGRLVVSKEQISCETRFNATPESAWLGAFRECAKLASLSMIKSRIRRAKKLERVERNKLDKSIGGSLFTSIKKTTHRKVQSMLISKRYKTEQDIFSYWDAIEECSSNRLIWCTIGKDQLNGKYAIHGAQAGTRFGLQHSDDIITMSQINDWDWLKKEFKNVII